MVDKLQPKWFKELDKLLYGEKDFLNNRIRKGDNLSHLNSYISPLTFGPPTVDDCIRLAQFHRAQWDARIAELERLKGSKEKADKDLEAQHKRIDAQVELLERQVQELSEQGLNSFQEGRNKEVESLGKLKDQLSTSVFKTKQQIDTQAKEVLREAGVEVPSIPTHKIFHNDLTSFYVRRSGNLEGF